MSDDNHEPHVEPKLPSSNELVNRLFVISMLGILSFIAVVFAFIIL